MLRESSCPRARAAQWNIYSSSWRCCFTFQSELLEGISRCISDLKAGIPRFQNIYCEHRETAPISPHFFNGWGRSDTHTVCEAHEHQREKLLLLSKQDLLSICASLKAPLPPPLRGGAWWKLVLLHSGMHLRHIKYLRKFISVWGGCSVLKCCSSQESAASPVHGLRKMVTNSFFFFFFKGKIKRKKQKGLRNVGWQHRSKLESEDSFFRRCCWGLLHNTGVLSPFIITLLSAPGTELCLFRLPHSFLSPLQKFLGKLQSSQARVV